MKSVEVNELLDIRELKERIAELLRLIKEGETIEVTSRNEVIAHFVPTSETQSVKAKAKDNQAFWAHIDQLATQIGAHWQDNMNAVDAIHDVRREL